MELYHLEQNMLRMKYLIDLIMLIIVIVVSIIVAVVVSNKIEI